MSGFTAVSEALIFLDDIGPEVVLLNPEMESGPKLLGELRRSWPGSAIVLLKTSSEHGGPSRGWWCSTSNSLSTSYSGLSGS